jgi:NTE family protein
MQQFLSSTESTLTIRSADDEAVKASIEGARMGAQQSCDLCLEGGGLPTAVGLVGAMTVLEERGFVVQRVAGASGGALPAALTAAGYSSAEIRELLLALDYRAFQRGAGLLRGRGRRKAPYTLDYLTEWVSDLLKSMGIETFADLVVPESSSSLERRFRLVVMAADLTQRELVRLPWDFGRYGLDPAEQIVADAVAAALAIPNFFEPLRLTHSGTTSVLADASAIEGHLISVFDRPEEPPRWPTFGMRLSVQANGKGQLHWEMPDEDRVRTIAIPSLRIMPTEFDVSRERTLALYEAGRSAAEEFLQGWDWQRYLETYRA